VSSHGYAPSYKSSCYQAEEKGSGELHLEAGDLEAAQAEIRRLEQKLAEVERELLKKAVNIFSRRGQLDTNSSPGMKASLA